MSFEDKKPYDFDRNQKTSALSKKEQPNTTRKNGKKLKLSNTYGFWANNLVFFG